MTRKTFFSCAMLACGLAGGLNASEVGPAPGLNRFSSALYAELAEGSGKNVVMSPFSISSALSMALAGARGQTAAEMAKVLGQDGAGPAYHAALASLVEQITKAANVGGNQFLSANGLWVQRDFKILPDFRDLLGGVYHAPLAELDFMGNPERARAEINAWTEKHTRGKIQNLFAPGALNGRTWLVLGSAVYFYGKWEHPFRRTDTKPAPFTLADGASRQADFMNQTARFGYAETPAGQVLEMRYAGTGLAFDILLPKKGAPLDSVDAGMNPERLAGWLGSLETMKVEASIPKFRVESEFPLTAVLSKLGMASAFNDSADFSGIDDRRDLQISKVVHKAYVDVAEEGTEAAAATGAMVSLIAMQVNKAPVFRADHPFAFLIRDTKTGVILFTGRVTDPKR